ncbi:uncharacterized protein LOC144145901 [Haemaphysalis longicornis]
MSLYAVEMPRPKRPPPTEEEILARKRRRAAAARRRYANQSEDARQHRLQRMREVMHQRVLQETPEERKVRLQRKREAARQRAANKSSRADRSRGVGREHQRREVAGPRSDPGLTSPHLENCSTADHSKRRFLTNHGVGNRMFSAFAKAFHDLPVKSASAAECARSKTWPSSSVQKCDSQTQCVVPLMFKSSQATLKIVFKNVEVQTRVTRKINAGTRMGSLSLADCGTCRTRPSLSAGKRDSQTQCVVPFMFKPSQTNLRTKFMSVEVQTETTKKRSSGDQLSSGHHFGVP